MHAFSPITWETEASDLCEFKSSLVYKECSRIVRAVEQRNPFWKQKQTNEHNQVFQIGNPCLSLN